MSDEIGRAMRRDLDQLPLLPAHRWLPVASRQRRTMTLVVRTLATLVVVVLALAAASGIDAIRAELAAKSQNAVGASPSLPGAVGIVPRQVAIDSVRGLGAEVRRVDRIEAKLVSADRLPTPAPGNSGPPSGGRFWIVAVSGEITCNCILDLTFTSATYTVDAQTGTIQGSNKSTDPWPPSFDRLVDEGPGP